jgi:hypothetical protein
MASIQKNLEDLKREVRQQGERLEAAQGQAKEIPKLKSIR